MKCDEYQQAIAADPSFDDDHGHAALCAACAQFKAGMQVLDATIAKALAIDVPAFRMPELPPLVETENKVVDLAARRKGPLSVPGWIGIAASFALAAIIVMQFFPDDSRSDQALADEIVAHIDHEPWALKVTDVAVSNERINSVMAANGGTLNTRIGLVSYAQSCIINGKTIPHLVVQGKNGPVTILLMPEEMVSMPVPVHGESIDGIILPLGDGSVAIVGERGFDLEDIKERVTNSVEWSI
jgi:hypothetical protein